MFDWDALAVTVRLATLTTLVLFVLGLPLSYWLAYSSWRGKWLIETIVALPLVLPPTVLGFYLLWIFGPEAPLGFAYRSLVGESLLFSFPGLVVASVLYNLPFAVRPFTAALGSVEKQYREAAYCLGLSPWQTFWQVTLPLAWPGVFGGAVLVFAHTVGEFGVVLMVGGNLSGRTRTLSISLYDNLQALEWQAAHLTAGVLLAFSFGVLALVHIWLRRSWTP